jgi:hypothetical protein
MFALQIEVDALGGRFEKPHAVSEHATLREAIHAQLSAGHGYIVHLPSGLERHAIPREKDGHDIVWLDAAGVQHPSPLA